VVIHYEEALYQVYAPLPFTFTVKPHTRLLTSDSTWNVGIRRWIPWVIIRSFCSIHSLNVSAVVPRVIDH